MVLSNIFLKFKVYLRAIINKKEVRKRQRKGEREERESESERESMTPNTKMSIIQNEKDNVSFNLINLIKNKIIHIRIIVENVI